MKNLKTVFEGLSSPNDLKKMWVEIKKDKMPEELLKVIWEYTSPKQLQNGFNVVNIKYNPKAPNEVGHYCLIIVDEPRKYVEFFNPVADRTADDLEKLIQLNDYFTKKHYEVVVDLSGKQEEDNEDCGYHCLTHAFNNIYRFTDGKSNIKEGGMFKNLDLLNSQASHALNLAAGIYYGLNNGWDTKLSGEIKPEATMSEKMDDVIKLLRGIYYGLKFGFDQPTQKKGKGVADEMSDNNAKKISYNKLKKIVKAYVEAKSV